MNSPDVSKTKAPLHHWVLHHDDSRLFIVAYIGLAVVLSAFVSLFWLLVVVGAHFGLEWYRQKHETGAEAGPLARALWELRLDLTLIVFAMVIALYMEYAIGVAGLRLAPRLGRAVTAGSRGASRFAAWSRILRAVLLSVDDAAQVLRAVVLRRSKGGSRPEKGSLAGMVAAPSGDEPGADAPEVAPPFQWTWGTTLLALFFGVSIALLLLTPVLTDHSPRSALLAMLAELHPLP